MSTRKEVGALLSNEAMERMRKAAEAEPSGRHVPVGWFDAGKMARMNLKYFKTNLIDAISEMDPDKAVQCIRDFAQDLHSCSPDAAVESFFAKLFEAEHSG